MVLVKVTYIQYKKQLWYYTTSEDKLYGTTV